MAFDPLNLLLLAIAVVVFWRLRSVLGMRTGNERPPPEPYAPPKPDAETGKVLRFPKDDTKAEPPEKDGEEEVKPIWTGFAEAGSAAALGIEQIAAEDGNFIPKAFVDGAKLAYEMIIEAFARGDQAALKPLLSKQVFDGFSQAIAEREQAGQKVESRFVGIDKAAIVQASAQDKRAVITMRFVSELISATYAKDGALIEGDPKLIKEITDVWTFERDLGSRDPNWKLISTEDPA